MRLATVAWPPPERPRNRRLPQKWIDRFHDPDAWIREWVQRFYGAGRKRPRDDDE